MDRQITPEGRLLSIDNRQVYVDMRAKGKTLVLVHGLGGPLMWQKVLPLLQKHYHVVVVHLPGFGRSDKPDAAYTVQFFVDTLSAIFRSLKIQRCVLTGISLGGRIAIEYALQSTEQVEKLVLISSAGLSGAAPVLKNPLVWGLFSLIARGIFLRSKWLMCKLAERSYYDLKSRPPDLCDKYFKQINQLGGRRAWLSTMKNTIVRDESFAERLRSLSVPTLIVWGKEDRTISVKDAREFHEGIQGSSLTIIPGCGHSVPLEKPQELAEAVRSFIE